MPYEESFDFTIEAEAYYHEFVEVFSTVADKCMQETYPHAISLRASDQLGSTEVTLTKEQAKELAQALLDAVAYLES